MYKEITNCHYYSKTFADDFFSLKLVSYSTSVSLLTESANSELSYILHRNFIDLLNVGVLASILWKCTVYLQQLVNTGSVK